jgi:hypothetical protein
MMADASTIAVRDAELPRDRDSVEHLWLEYLSWGNDEMQRRHGFRLSLREGVVRDLGMGRSTPANSGQVWSGALT